MDWFDDASLEHSTDPAELTAQSEVLLQVSPVFRVPWLVELGNAFAQGAGADASMAVVH
jgi:hypothetical protein